MQRCLLCFFVLLTACTQKRVLIDEKVKKHYLERLYKMDIKSSPPELFRLTDSLLNSSIKSDSVFLTKVIYYKARSLFSQQKTKEAIHFFESVNSFFEINKVYDFKVKSGLYLAMCYADLGAYTQANITGVQAKNDAIKFGDFNLISSTLESLSYLAFKNHNHEMALSYMHEAEAYYRQQKKMIKLSTTLNNLGILYRNMRNPEKAQHYQEEALQLNLENEDVLGIAKSYSNLGLLAEEQGKDKIAIDYYLKAIKINTDNDFISSSPILNIASLYFKRKNYAQATSFYTKAIDILKDKKDHNKLKEVYNVLFNISTMTTDLLKAQYYKSILESLESEIALNNAIERNMMLEKQEELLKQKLALETKQTNDKITRFSLFIVLILLLMIIFYFTQRFRTIRFIHERNTMDLELKVLRSQMNPHFIFNTLTSIQNQMLSNDPLAAAHSISQFSKLIRQNFEFTSKNEIILTEDIDALKNYLATQQMRYDQKFSYTITIDETIRSSKLLMPPMLLQPFVENAIEHGFKNIPYKGIIDVSIKKLTPYLIQFSIIDNGVGYSPKLDSSLHAIDVIKKRLRLNEAGDEDSFQIKSLGINKGTQVIFNLFTKFNENINNRR